MRAIVVAAVLVLAGPAYALRPLPGPAPDWRQAKSAIFAAYDRVEAAYPDMRRHDDREIHDILGQLRALAEQVEFKQRNERDRALMWEREYGLPGEDAGEVSMRLRYFYDVHMAVLYGWILPTAFNEGFSDAAKDIFIPGYPLRTMLISDVQYCRDYQPAGQELVDLFNAQTSIFERPPGPGFCDTVVSGRSAQ